MYLGRQPIRLSHQYAQPRFLLCLHYMHGRMLCCHSLTKIYGNTPFQLHSVQCTEHTTISVLHVWINADICIYYVYEIFTAFALDFLQILCCWKRLNPHQHYHHPHPTTILQSLRVQAPKSIERKKSALWSSPYICQGGKAGGAALMGHTGEQYHSICHKPFHLWWDEI